MHKTMHVCILLDVVVISMYVVKSMAWMVQILLSCTKALVVCAQTLPVADHMNILTVASKVLYTPRMLYLVHRDYS
jgi:hypothetical protein